MLAITCDKCRRRYTATDDELRGYLQQAEGKKYAQVICPHCGKPSKVAENRIQQALRFSPAPAAQAAGSAEVGPSSETANGGSTPEEENPAA